MKIWILNTLFKFMIRNHERRAWKNWNYIHKVSPLWCLRARQLYRTESLQPAERHSRLTVYIWGICLSFSVHAHTQSSFYHRPRSRPLFTSLVWSTDSASYSLEIPDKCHIGCSAVSLNPRPFCAYSNARAHNKSHVLQVIKPYIVGF
jgi:hypothetical protein